MPIELHADVVRQIDDVALSPQPLPPRLLGELVGREVLRVSWMARQLGVEFDVLSDWDDEICPPWPEVPVVPKHVWAFALPDPDQDWIRAYHLGLSLTLAQADGWQRHAPIVREALEKSTAALSASMG
jgi:hypothetical protein